MALTHRAELQIARVLSGFFLVIQIVVLLEFTFVVNEWLIERVDYVLARAALILGTSWAERCLHLHGSCCTGCIDTPHLLLPGSTLW